MEDHTARDRFLEEVGDLGVVSLSELHRVREALSSGRDTAWAIQELLKRSELTPAQVARIQKIAELAEFSPSAETALGLAAGGANLSRIETRELPRRAPMPGAGALLGDRFRLVEEIGRGSQGTVFRARDEHLERDVAVKVLRTDAPGMARERFEREARILSQLGHPGLVTVYEAGTGPGGTLYYAMELVEGRGLDEVFDDGGVLPENVLVRVLEEVALAIHHAHDVGLIHRDLKPGNILIDEGGTPKIADFGLVSLAEGTRLTMTRGVVGTPVYMAPEQAEGERVDRRADVYSLGAILYQGLVGRPPFTGSTPLEIFRRVVAEEPVPPRALQPSASPLLERVCLRALQKDPRRRYPTAAAFGRDLRRAHEGQTLAPERLAPLVGRRLARVSRGHSLGLALLLGFAVGVVLMGLRTAGPAPERSTQRGGPVEPSTLPKRAENREQLLELARGERGYGLDRAAIRWLQLLDEGELLRDPQALKHLALARALEALSWISLGELERAQQALERALIYSADQPLVGVARAALAHEAGHLQVARDLLREALEQDPKLVEAHLLLARCGERLAVRRTAATRAVELTEPRPWRRALRVRVEVALEGGDLAGALTDIERLRRSEGPREARSPEWPEDPRLLRAQLEAGLAAVDSATRPLLEQALQVLEEGSGLTPNAQVGSLYRVEEVLHEVRRLRVRDSSGKTKERQEENTLRAVYHDTVEEVAPGGQVLKLVRTYQQLEWLEGLRWQELRGVTVRLVRQPGESVYRLQLSEGLELSAQVIDRLRVETAAYCSLATFWPAAQLGPGGRWEVPPGLVARRLRLDPRDLPLDRGEKELAWGTLLSRRGGRVQAELVGSLPLRRFAGLPTQGRASGVARLNFEWSDPQDPRVGVESWQAFSSGVSGYKWAGSQLEFEIKIQGRRRVEGQ